jgi:rubrerythrin
MENWYKIAQMVERKGEIRMPRVKISDYRKYHYQLKRGVKDEGLLDKMAYTLKPIVDYVLYNSYLRQQPNFSKFCDKCNPKHDMYGDRMVFWDESMSDEQIMENESLNEYDEGYEEIFNETKKNIKEKLIGNEDGFWECKSCGTTENFEDVLNSAIGPDGNWMQTDQNERLEKYSKDLTSSDFDKKHASLEMVLQFVHGSGPMADWFIEGGDFALSEFRDD